MSDLIERDAVMEAWAVFRDDGEQVSCAFHTFEAAATSWWRVYDHAEYLVLPAKFSDAWEKLPIRALPRLADTREPNE